MNENKAERDDTETLLFPYYIDQARLLDIYAALNGGYSAYEEITTTLGDQRDKSGQAKLNVGGGFKMLNIGANATGERKSISSSESKFLEKKVQTSASMLSLIVSELCDRCYIEKIGESSPGSFVIEPVVPQINSLKSLMQEVEQLQSLSISMQSLDPQFQKTGAKKARTGELKTIREIVKVAKDLFDAEEIVCQRDELAIVGDISDNNLYQARRSDIANTDLICLAQVKRIHDNGTQLLRNTVFSKLKNIEEKQGMIDSIKTLLDNGVYEYDATVLLEIVDKPVYEVEIIALYQEACASGD